MKIATMKSLLVIPVIFLSFFHTTANAQPVHDISLVASSNTVYEGQAFSVFVDYDAYDTSTPSVHLKSMGVGIGVYFDSSQVTFTGIEYLAPPADPAMSSAVPDSSNEDENALTDKFIPIGWYVFDNPTWPEGALPQFIAVLNFVLLTPDGAQLGIKGRHANLSGGFVTSGVSIAGRVRIPGDLDCDGVVTLDDGIRMLRILSGIEVAVTVGCPRPLGDFDGNGKTGLADCVGVLQTIAGIR